MKKNISILIVEDEAYSALFLQDALSIEGYDICDTVATGEKAIKAVENKVPDVILMDIHLAGEINGIEAVGQIRLKNKVPVIFISGYRDRELIEKAQKMEPLAFLVKPFDVGELCAKIDSAFPPPPGDEK